MHDKDAFLCSPAREFMFRLLGKFPFSSKPVFSADYKLFLNKYKESVNQIISSLNLSNSLEKIGVKLVNSKKYASLSELATINIIDSQKAELTTFDPQLTKYVISSLQSAGLNLTITTLTPSKLVLHLPKQASSSKNLIVDQVKKRTDQFKNELREIRRKEINDFRMSTKDKDEIRNFELQTQKKYDNLISEIDKEHDNALKMLVK